MDNNIPLAQEDFCFRSCAALGGPIVQHGGDLPVRRNLLVGERERLGPTDWKEAQQVIGCDTLSPP